MRLYRAALADVPDAVLERAALTCLRLCTYWPTVAEVLREVAAIYAKQPSRLQIGPAALSLADAEAEAETSLRSRFEQGDYTDSRGEHWRSRIRLLGCGYAYGDSYEACLELGAYWMARNKRERWQAREDAAGQQLASEAPQAASCVAGFRHVGAVRM